MTRYEYKVINTRQEGCPMNKGDTIWDKLESGLTKLGSDGWQLCGFSSTTMVFMRERAATQAEVERDMKTGR